VASGEIRSSSTRAVTFGHPEAHSERRGAAFLSTVCRCFILLPVAPFSREAEAKEVEKISDWLLYFDVWHLPVLVFALCVEEEEEECVYFAAGAQRQVQRETWLVGCALGCGPFESVSRRVKKQIDQTGAKAPWQS